MSKIYLYPAVIPLLLLAPAAPVQSAPPGSVDPEAVFAEGAALEKTDLKGALEYYCEAARQGHGPAQAAVGRIYAARPGTQTGDNEGRRDVAAAMMWLDIAILNRMKDMRAGRRKLGVTAQPEDFALYGRFTRMEIDAPCTWAEVYEPPEENREEENK